MIITPICKKIYENLSYILDLDDKFRISNPSHIETIYCPSCDQPMIRYSSKKRFNGFDCKECAIAMYDFVIKKNFNINGKEYYLVWQFTTLENIIIYFYNIGHINNQIHYLEIFIPFNISIEGFKKLLLLA